MLANSLYLQEQVREDLLNEEYFNDFINYPISPGTIVQDDSSPSTYNSGYLTPKSSPLPHFEQQPNLVLNNGPLADAPIQTHSFLPVQIRSASRSLDSKYESPSFALPHHLATSDYSGPIGGVDNSYTQYQPWLVGLNSSTDYHSNESWGGQVPNVGATFDTQYQDSTSMHFLGFGEHALDAVYEPPHNEQYISTPLWDNVWPSDSVPLDLLPNYQVVGSSGPMTEDPLVPSSQKPADLPIRNSDGHSQSKSHSSAAKSSSGNPAASSLSSSSRRGKPRVQSSSQHIMSSGAVAKPRAQRGLVPRGTPIGQADVLPSGAFAPPGYVHVSNAGIPKNGYGGRHGPLKKTQRDKAKAMRHKHACWICAMQRIPCNDETICHNCTGRLSRYPTNSMGCNRTVLPEMLKQFLPLRMSQAHELGVVSMVVKGSVAGWVNDVGDKGLTVHLTVGYGPVFTWQLHEYVPITHQVAIQLQWEKGPVESGQTITCVPKISPPLAIKRFTEEDTRRFRQLMEDLVDDVIEKDLDAFLQIYCNDQDDDPFRAALLHLLCILFRSVPPDSEHISLRGDLKAALRSLIATDMMLHYLTLHNGSKNDIISQMRNSSYNDPSTYGDHTSPKLVNRQCKVILSSLQERYCVDMLSRLHKILRSVKGPKKNITWLSAFVLLLAMAICQEELEHNRFLRADGDFVRDRSRPAQSYIDDARQDCRIADEGFDFLLTLFNRKYSPQKRYVAHLEDWVTIYNNRAERQFLQSLVCLVKPYHVYLLQRKDGETLSAKDMRYKSRLVARFLVGFMSLDLPMDGNHPLFRIPL